MSVEPEHHSLPEALRILVVDDHEPMRISIRSLLCTQSDFEVICEAKEGGSAVEKAKELNPDVIVLDISMPGMNGFEVARRIRALRLSSKIVFLSQHEALQPIREAFRAGGNGYVAKSDAAQDLIPAIRAAVANRRYVNPKFAAALREAS
jgi:two-component system, NarL family, response regulator DesR